MFQPASLLAVLCLCLVAVGGICGDGGPAPSLAERARSALQGALVADRLALAGYGAPSRAEASAAYGGLTEDALLQMRGRGPAGIREAFAESWAARASVVEPLHSLHGQELWQATQAVHERGFEFRAFAREWQSGRGSGDGGSHVAEESPDAAWREALGHLESGVLPEASGSHYVDLGGAVRVPALLLLAEHAGADDLAAASREIQRFSHENPKALQAGELLLRAALVLLRQPQRLSCSRAERRGAVADALHEAARAAGPQYGAVVDEALAEAQSRASIDEALAEAQTRGAPAASKAGPGARGALASIYGDSAVLARMTSSGDALGEEMQGGKIAYIMPAIIWFAIAYDSFEEAVLASALLGGESAARGVFVGLLQAAAGPAAAEPSGPLAFLRALQAVPAGCAAPGFVPVLRLCANPGVCREGALWKGERRMHGVVVQGAVVPLSAPGTGGRYRIFTRIDASELLSSLDSAQERPLDWDDAEDGPWEPPDPELASGRTACLARYFQFTTLSGRHAPFGVWPSAALCKLTRAVPEACDSFDVVLPEALSQLIGGVIIGKAERDVKMPSLSTDLGARVPEWALACGRVGLLRLPEGKWELESQESLYE